MVAKAVGDGIPPPRPLITQI